MALTQIFLLVPREFETWDGGGLVFDFGELRRWDRGRVTRLPVADGCGKNLYLAGYSSSRSQFMMWCQ